MPVDAGTSGTAGGPAGEAALDTLRTKTKTLGSNVALLQTRQQLGIQALSFAGQAEQGILALFR
ncbi:MAG: hypothetical protein IH925_08915 [Proteobacteria bacterium]|nr:hypothetical protein [Pseudomonadota bacterium]